MMHWGSAMAGALSATAMVIGADVLLRDITAPPPPPTRAAVTTLTPTAQVPKSGDGHFWADTAVNGAIVRTLVDTGSTLVALTRADARAVGIAPEALEYSHPVDTAAGRVKAARVELASIAVGDIVRSGVDAIVVADGLEYSLLGMSFLGQLRLEATPEGLYLSD